MEICVNNCAIDLKKNNLYLCEVPPTTQYFRVQIQGLLKDLPSTIPSRISQGHSIEEKEIDKFLIQFPFIADVLVNLSENKPFDEPWKPLVNAVFSANLPEIEIVLYYYNFLNRHESDLATIPKGSILRKFSPSVFSSSVLK